MENFINTLALKISDYESMYLDDKNQIIFECYNDVINEFHSNIYKSENIYNDFIIFLDDIIKKINNETKFKKSNKNIKKLINKKEVHEILSDETFKQLLNKENDLLLNEDSFNEYKKELETFKKIKDELYNSEIVTKNNLKLMIDFFNKKENKINKNLIKNLR